MLMNDHLNMNYITHEYLYFIFYILLCFLQDIHLTLIKLRSIYKKNHSDNSM